ncbi:MAG: GEVED domain-containing protein [Bacteroidota bacterium]
MKFKNLLFALTLVMCGSLFAQESFPPSEIITGTYKGKTIPLRDFPTFVRSEHGNLKTMIVIPNESNTVPEPNNTTTVIENLQTEMGKLVAPPLEQNFIGVSQSESGFLPPDPTGAVGPNHYVHSVNSLVKIFDKTGNLLVGPVSLSSFLGNGSNNGDPIVLYDQLADRWVVSEFGAGANSLSIGVSETNDPTGSYNVWDYTFGGFPDYPHYGVWHDGYYGTVNLNGQTTQGFVMERDVMLAGGANPQIYIFNLPQVIVNPNQVKSPAAVNLLGTTVDNTLPGYIVYLQDDAWGGVSVDHLKVWEIDVDWANPGNSNISTPQEIVTDPFDAGELFGNGNGALRQPNTSQRLAGHGGIISYGANFRDFGSHHSWLITFNTFIDANETGGIRWIELRSDGVNPWSIFQEGTFSIADGHSRLMSSAAMDAAGNIAMGYTVGSTTLPVSLRYTGRFASDPLGTMTVAETTIIDGPGVRTNSNRYGDYAHTTMDPDNFTFWYTADYFSSNNQWRTQVAAFSLSGGFANDVGVIDIVQPTNGVLTATESVEVEIRNYGSATQTTIPLELRVDGNLVATENYTGSILANATDTFTFAQTVDLSNAGTTYNIEVRSNLGGDEFTANDSFSKDVSSLFANDVGTLEVTAPVSGQGLGMETISANLRNFGAAAQSNFDVQYTINGGTAVVETFSGTLNSEEEAVFDFATQGDFTALDTYTVVVSTDLTGDQQASNDDATTVIESEFCTPAGNCTAGRRFDRVQVREIDRSSGCEGYADFTSDIATMAPGGTYDITFTVGYGRFWTQVWIDFNDDLVFSPDEIVVPNFEIAPGQNSGPHTETVQLNVPAGAAIGEHRMRVRGNWNSPVVDGCELGDRGETEDYTANIGELGLTDFEISESDLQVISLPNNQFEVTLITDYDEGVYLGLYNILGQEVGFEKKVARINGTYKQNLDLSKMSSGVYIIRMGGHGTTSYKTARIIVE